MHIINYGVITNYPMTILIESFVIIYIVIVVQVVRTLNLIKWWLFMTYLDNEILTNAKHIHMAFHELVGHTLHRSLPR